ATPVLTIRPARGSADRPLDLKMTAVPPCDSYRPRLLGRVEQGVPRCVTVNRVRDLGRHRNRCNGRTWYDVKQVHATDADLPDPRSEELTSDLQSSEKTV